MRLSALPILLGLGFANGSVRLRKTHASYNKIHVEDEIISSGSEMSTLFGDIDSEVLNRFLTASMSMTTNTSQTSTDSQTIGTPSSQTNSSTISTKLPSPVTSTIATLDENVSTTMPKSSSSSTDKPGDEIIVVDTETGEVSSRTSPGSVGVKSQTLGSTSSATSTTHLDANTSPDRVSVAGIMGATVACVAALAGAAFVIQKRRHGRRDELPMF